MKTIYGLDVKTQWNQILDLHALKLAREHHPDWYYWKLSNNFERAVFLKGDPVFPRETTRYLWANQNILGKEILEIGCSTGYGSQFLPKDIWYEGLDYDPIIIQVAQEQEWGEFRTFLNANINEVELLNYDTIIAFEVIEHMDNGLKIIEKLKKHCKRLLITVPHNEPKGFWGEHHKLHDLNESHFPCFEFQYINEHGKISDTPQNITEQNRCNLLIGKWDG